MSEIETEEFLQQFEGDGTADWIRQQVASGTEEGFAPPVAEAPDTETVEADEEVEPDESTDEPEAPAAEVEPEDEPEDAPDAEVEDTLYLDLTPESEALLAKYGGDLGKALEAAVHAQSKIGEQGNELGSLRTELAQFRAEVQAGINRPQVEWPDEFTETDDAVRQFRAIADDAVAREDKMTFDRAMEHWNEVDPTGAETWATMKYTQMLVAEHEARTAAPTTTLEDGVTALATEFPKLGDPAFQAEVNAELARFPTLAGVFQDQTADPAERVAALREAASIVASRQADGDAQQAVRRVAVRTSEEARKTRAEARVATSSGKGKVAAPADRQIQVGRTGISVGENDLKAQIKALADLDIEIG